MDTLANQSTPETNQIELPADIRLKLGLPLDVPIAFLRRGKTVSLIPAYPLHQMIGSMPEHDWTPDDLRDHTDAHERTG